MATDILSLQDPKTGAFSGDSFHEQDSRFSYCAVSALSLLSKLDLLDRDLTVGFIERCSNFDGGFGMIPGAESHAAYGRMSTSAIIARN
jgi:geranylgeranyl transferase type-2 subunit beta